MITLALPALSLLWSIKKKIKTENYHSNDNTANLTYVCTKQGITFALCTQRNNPHNNTSEKNRYQKQNETVAQGVQ